MVKKNEKETEEEGGERLKINNKETSEARRKKRRIGIEYN